MRCDGFMFRNSYNLFIDDTLVSDRITDGDVVEVLSDPESFIPSVR